jgi:hypothetical protein
MIVEQKEAIYFTAPIAILGLIGVCICSKKR